MRARVQANMDKKTTDLQHNIDELQHQITFEENKAGQLRKRIQASGGGTQGRQEQLLALLLALLVFLRAAHAGPARRPGDAGHGDAGAGAFLAAAAAVLSRRLHVRCFRSSRRLLLLQLPSTEGPDTLQGQRTPLLKVLSAPSYFIWPFDRSDLGGGFEPGSR